MGADALTQKELKTLKSNVDEFYLYAESSSIENTLGIVSLGDEYSSFFFENQETRQIGKPVLDELEKSF